MLISLLYVIGRLEARRNYEDIHVNATFFDNGRFLLLEEAITPDLYITRMHTAVYMSQTQK
jgi:hypothetical protein